MRQSARIYVRSCAPHVRAAVRTSLALSRRSDAPETALLVRAHCAPCVRIALRGNLASSCAAVPQRTRARGRGCASHVPTTVRTRFAFPWPSDAPECAPDARSCVPHMRTAVRADLPFLWPSGAPENAHPTYATVRHMCAQRSAHISPFRGSAVRQNLCI